MLTDESVVTLHDLQVGAEEESGVEIGRSETGTFISLPPEGVALIRWLQAGLPLGEVKRRFAEAFGVAPDLDDFLNGIASCGFVRGIDGQPVNAPADAAQDRPAPRSWRLLATLAPERVAWLLADPLRIGYLAVWLAVPILLLIRPSLRPSAEGAWLPGQATLTLIALTVLGWGLVFLHELAHLLALKARGGSGSLTLSHRLYFLVAQTDLTAIRALPYRQRYAPYLAGMTCDLLVLLGCLLLQLAGVTWWLPRMAAYVLAVGLLFQFAFFMRTDVYYVFANWLRLGNLMQDTQHWIVNLAGRWIGRPPRFDLSAVPARELRVVRYYAAFYVVGIAVAVIDFLVFGLPLLIHFVRQAVAGLSWKGDWAAFADSVIFLALTAAQFAALGYVVLRDRRQRRAEAAATAPLALTPAP